MEKQSFQFPSTFPNIIGSEFSERFSYYGYRALITLFLTSAACGLTDEQATGITYNNVALTYAVTVIGGIVADWFLGRYRTILYFSLLCCLGHFLLSFYIRDCNLDGIRWSLFFIAAGAGFIKPNVSALLGDQFIGKGGEMVNRAFSWFYFSINCGSFLSFLLIPKMRTAFGYEVAFAIPGILMALATFVLFLGRKRYIHVKPTGIPKNNFVGFHFEALKLYFSGNKHVWGTMTLRHGEEKVDAILAVWRVTAFFAFVPLAMAMFEFGGGDYVVDAKSLNLNFGLFSMEAEQVQIANAIFVLALIPLTFKIFPLVEKWTGRPFHPKQRMLFGYLFILLATFLEGLIKDLVAGGVEVHAGYQIGVYFILTIGEVLFSITGLEYGYTHAPKTMKSTVSSIWLLTTAVGTAFSGYIKGLMDSSPFWYFLKEGGNFYWFFCGLFLVNVSLFAILSKRIKEKIYL